MRKLTFVLFSALVSGPAAAVIPPEAWTRDMAASGYEDGAPLGGFGAGTITYTYKGNFYKDRLILGAETRVNDADSGIYFYQKPSGGAVSAGRLDSSLGAGQATYASLYPKAWVRGQGSRFPVKFTLTQFTPLIPNDYQRSSYPVAAYQIEFTNSSATDSEVAIMLAFNNSFGGTTVAAYTGAGASGVKLGRGAAVATLENQGEFTLAVKPPAGVSVSWGGGANAAALATDFNADGVLGNVGGAFSRGAVAFKALVPAGASLKVPLVLAWDLPIHQVGTGNKWYKRYTRYFTRTGLNSGAMAQEALDNIDLWESQIDAWQAGVLGNASYPGWLKTGLFNELYFYTAGGTVWEAGAASGQPDDPNEDMFSHLETYIYDFYGTSDVRFYGSWALLMNWPEIDKQAVRQFSDSVSTARADRPAPLGTTAHDFGDRNTLFAQWNAYVYRDSTQWKDLNSKFVLMAWRDYQYTGSSDSGFLAYVWPSVKIAMAKVKSQDSDADGLPNSAGIDQTYDDMDLTGDTSYCGGLFLAACLAAKQIALAVGDSAQAAVYQAWFDLAQPNFDTQLWNGSYYKIDTGSIDPNRVMSDQLCGQWYAKACGLGGIVSDARAVTAFTSVYNNNVMSFDSGAHGACNVMNPDNSIDTSTPQTQEVWVGTSWGLAAGMHQQGLYSQAANLGAGLYNSIWNQGQFWFRTPEAWRTGLSAMRAPYYMRATAIWALKHAYDISPNPCGGTCSPTPTPTATPCFSIVATRRVNAGGAQQTTGGNTWSADQAYAAGGWGYVGGNIASTSNAIAATTDDILYQSSRYGMSQYRFTLPNGAYRVELHLAETYWTYAGARVMSVSLEGQPMASGLDIYASAGGNTALVLTGDGVVSDGVLDLGFSASADQPEIRAIAIFPATACPNTPSFTPSPNWTATATPTISPTRTRSPTATQSPSISPTPSATPTACGNQVLARLNAGGGAFTDSLGNLWSADQYFTGGNTATVANAIASTSDDALYQSERWGSPLSYAIPAAYNGNYQVRFFFAETYHAAAGLRIFSVSLEGAVVISNLDIFANAGGANTALQVTRVVSVSDGSLNIAATASVDQAKFNAIELIYLGAPCASPTLSPTAAPPTFTASPSSSRTVSATLTLSRSASPSPSPTRTASPSDSVTPSPSFTRSATPTGTAAPSLSRTPSFTASGTQSATVLPSLTPSFTIQSTGSATQSPLATATRSNTALPSPTFTAQFTGSATLTPMPSATFTLQSTGSVTDTALPSPSASPSSLPSATATLQPTGSVTDTPLASPSLTASAVVSATSSATDAPSATPSPQVSETLTATAIPSATSTVQPTASATSVASASPSPPASATLSATPVATASSTSLPSMTATATPPSSATPTRSSTPSVTRSATLQATAAATASPTPQASPSSSSTALATATDPGVFGIDRWSAVPNPNPVGFSLHLTGRADEVRVLIYSKGMTRVLELSGPGLSGPGWVWVPLPKVLSAGYYTAVAYAYRGGERSARSKPIHVFIWR